MVKAQIARYAEDDNAEGLEIWEYYLQLLEKLDEDGMSSDESDVDEHTSMHVYRVKRMPWRADVVGDLEVIDDLRNDLRGVFKASGSKPLLRLRGGEGGLSRRGAPRNRPKSLYQKTWLQGLKEAEREDLDISQEKFKLLTIRLR